MGSRFSELLAELLRDHQRGVAAAFACITVALVARMGSRGRVQARFSLVYIALYLASLPLQALLISQHLEGERDLVTLPAEVCLSFGIIGLSSMVLFDVLGRSFRKLRILRDVTSIIAAIVVLFVLLHQTGVNLSSIVATSAVLTGVIGFALQETLGNVIGGIALQLETTLSIGDWITVGEVTGQVAEIRWRSTAIVTRNDDLIIIPNGQLAKGQITNLSRPVGWHRQWVYINIHNRHPPNEVQRVVIEALKGVPNVKPDHPAPDCILFRAEQDHHQYAVRYRLTDLRQDDTTDSEVRKRIWYALRRNGIEIPYPSRNIFVTELNKEREEAKWHKEHVRRLQALQRVGIFGPLAEEHLEHLADGCQVEVFGAGETILRQGAPGDSLFVIRRGSVAVRVTIDQTEHEVALLTEGQLFGEMSLMTGEARAATVVAKTDAECYVIDRALFQEVIGRRTTLVNDISEILTSRQQELIGEVAHIDAEVAKAREAQKKDLIGRIKSFFSMGAGSG